MEKPDWDQFARELADDWDKSSPWSLSGSIDLKDKGVELDVEYRDPLEPQADSPGTASKPAAQ